MGCKRDNKNNVLRLEMNLVWSHKEGLVPENYTSNGISPTIFGLVTKESVYNSNRKIHTILR